jgi:O-antigen/teichoic acid export membrane protein
VEKSILFITVALLPVTLVFVVAPSLLLDVLYQGRYATAAPLLRIFGSLSLVVPLYAVCTNALMGLGKAKEGFHLGLAMLAVSFGVYFVFTPLLGSAGAALGFVVASFIMGWISARVAARYIPFTASGVLRRIGDIRMFLTTNARKYFSR